MDQSKKGFLSVLQGVKLSKTQCPTTAEEREKMSVILYALAMGSIICDVLHGVNLSKTQCPATTEDREKMSVTPFASAIGSIMYAMMCTRLDVSLAISMAGRFQSNLGVDHWTTVKNILKYLKRTNEMFLVY